MPQFGVITFDGVSLALVRQRFMLTGMIDQVGIGGELIGVLLAGGRRRVEHGLQTLRLAVEGHIVGDHTARGAISLGDDVDPFFLILEGIEFIEFDH